jgi:hypothetical protein
MSMHLRYLLLESKGVDLILLTYIFPLVGMMERTVFQDVSWECFHTQNYPVCLFISGNSLEKRKGQRKFRDGSILMWV